MAWRPDDPHRPSPPPDMSHITPRVILRDGTAWIFVGGEPMLREGIVISPDTEKGKE
jgi:hypothetical protein